MTKEKIIEMILSQDGTPNGIFITLDILRCEHIADELLALIEQARKETAKQIFQRLFDICFDEKHHYCVEAADIKFIARREYGVEVEL